jgi:hypothetical protein
MHTYKTLHAETGESFTNLRQLVHIGKLPEPDGRIGISPYWNAGNPKVLAFIANHKAATRHEAEQAAS